MISIKLVKKTEKNKSNFGHTTNEWGTHREIFKIHPIKVYDPKQNAYRNNDESLEESMKDCSFCSKCGENNFIPKLNITKSV